MIQYEKLFESGICELSEGWYSKTLSFEDINYQNSQREDQLNIFADYCELLNGCDETTHLNVTLTNRKIDLEAFEREMFYEKGNDAQDIYRNELNSMLRKSITEGQNGFLKENYLTFASQARSFDQARRFLERTGQTLMSNLSNMGVESRTLDGLQRLEYMHDLLIPHDFFSFDYKELAYNRLSTKAAMAPASF